uniref:Uncharacterized protein n=1 Tax=viral metagenome TaxID=1070528 RepID=A0A6C0C3E6_9ZZZZ
MPSQIFKTSPPVNILFGFLDTVCEKHSNKYIFSKANFKKAQLEDKIQPFCDKLQPHYHESKTFYVTRDMIYKNFITLIRQICKYNHIAFTTVMKYNKSKYEIIYSIFIPEQLIVV